MGMMEVTICIATYGSEYWLDKGIDARCDMTALGFTTMHNHLYHGTLAQARNLCLAEVCTQYVIFLDADDLLAPNYLEEISKCDADVIVPSVSYQRNRVSGPPHIPRVSYCSHDGPCCPDCLDRGNYIVIGAAARTAAVRAVGGFRDWPMYEDWDLWLRMAQAGYWFANCPDAVYLATHNENSRNRAPSNEQKLEAHRLIARANGVWVP